MDRLFSYTFPRDLRRLNDTLSQTELAGRYWVWAGVLLGWAREGRLLPHDRDADFALREEDWPVLRRSIPTLERAGFTPYRQFRTNDGKLSEVTFQRHGAKFEFFLVGSSGDHLIYHVFGFPPDRLVQIKGCLPRQELVPFDFLGRRWLRHANFDLELTAIYGDWRTPQRDWSYLDDDLAAIDRRAWTNCDTSWRD